MALYQIIGTITLLAVCSAVLADDISFLDNCGIVLTPGVDNSSTSGTIYLRGGGNHSAPQTCNLRISTTKTESNIYFRLMALRIASCKTEVSLYDNVDDVFLGFLRPLYTTGIHDCNNRTISEYEDPRFVSIIDDGIPPYLLQVKNADQLSDTDMFVWEYTTVEGGADVVWPESAKPASNPIISSIIG